MKHILFVLSMIIIVYFIIPSYLQLKSENKKLKSVLFKGLGTLFAVSFGLIGTLLIPSTHSYLILLGLVLGLIGDIFLEFSSPVGGIAFFFGNVIYLFSMLSLESLKPLHYLLFSIFLLFLLFSFWKRSISFGKLRVLVVPYGVLIAFMASVAIPFTVHYASTNASLCLFGFGAFLFVVSDYLLAYRLLYKPQPSFYKVSLGTYYIAQLCIGASLLL